MKKEDYDYIVIGAGPAGLQMGYFLDKASRDYLVLERADIPGSYFKTMPRHRKLLSINKYNTGYTDPVVNLRWDWSSLLSDSEDLLMKNYSKEYFPDASNLLEYLKDFDDHYKLNIQYNTAITKVSKNGSKFTLVDKDSKQLTCKYLIVATGFPEPFVPDDIEGAELAENYFDVSIDPEDFNNQRVLIIGKGNSGFEVASNLISTSSLIHLVSPDPLEMAWRSHYPGDLRAVNNNVLDTYQLKALNAVINANVMKIEKDDQGKYLVTMGYKQACGEVEQLSYDRVIMCTGFRFDPSIYDSSCNPELTACTHFPTQTSEWMSTNVEGMYFAGILMHVRDYHKSASAFIHGYRYNICALSHILGTKNHNVPLPFKEIPRSANQLCDMVIQRVNKTSALWQQYNGFICDCIVLPQNGNDAQYYEEIPFDYLQDSELGKCNKYYTVSLEYGKQKFIDPFNAKRIEKHDVSNAAQSHFLHPVVRQYDKTTLIAEHHVIEDFASEWKEKEHVEPLAEFFDKSLSELFA